MNYIYLEHPLKEPPDEWWNEDAETVDDVAGTPEVVAAILESGEFDLGGFASYDKVMKVHGMKLTVCDALIVAALSLPDDQALVVLQDAYAELRKYLEKKVSE